MNITILVYHSHNKKTSRTLWNERILIRGVLTVYGITLVRDSEALLWHAVIPLLIMQELKRQQRRVKQGCLERKSDRDLQKCRLQMT